MEERIWQLPEFECESIPHSQLRQKWLEYKNSFQYAIEAISPTRYTEQRWKSIFLSLASPQVQRVYESLPDYNLAEEERDDDDDSGNNVFLRITVG